MRRPPDDRVGRVARQRVMNVVAAQRHVWTGHDGRNDVVNHLAVSGTCNVKYMLFIGHLVPRDCAILWATPN